MKAIYYATAIVINAINSIKPPEDLSADFNIRERRLLSVFIVNCLSEDKFLNCRFFGQEGVRPRSLRKAAFEYFLSSCTVTISQAICIYDGDHPNIVNLGLDEHYMAASKATAALLDAGYLSRYLMTSSRPAAKDGLVSNAKLVKRNQKHDASAVKNAS